MRSAPRGAWKSMFQVKSFRGFRDLAVVVLIWWPLVGRQAPSSKAQIDWGLGS